MTTGFYLFTKVLLHFSYLPYIEKFYQLQKMSHFNSEKQVRYYSDQQKNNKQQ